MSASTTSERLKAWVNEWAGVLQPRDIHWCDGSAQEYDALCRQLVDSGTFTRLDEAKRPNSYWAHSDPGDVARVEDRTFICSVDAANAGPTNNWREPATMRDEMTTLYTGAIHFAQKLFATQWCRAMGRRCIFSGVRLCSCFRRPNVDLRVDDLHKV